MNKKIFIIVFSLFTSVLQIQAVTPREFRSPNGRITMDFTKSEGLQFFYDRKLVLTVPQIGLTTTGHGEGAKLDQVLNGSEIVADYTMIEGKRLHCTNRAFDYYLDYKDAKQQPMRLVVRLYNDGIAMRYELTGLNNEQLKSELTTYEIPEGTRRWMMPWSDGAEGFYPLSTTGKGRDRRWGFPALLQPADDVFVLLTESNIERRQSAASLHQTSDELYQVRHDKNEVPLTGDWHTPWRVAIVGSLADVVGSTLATDVAEPSKVKDTSWIHPGVVSWVYWAYNHGSNDYNIIKKYVDLAVALHLPYVLIDAEWDEMKDGKTIEDAVAYAKEKGVKPMIWYNSSVGWINGAPGPKFRLNKLEDREKEFAWCERIGVAGVKIDFFAGETQANMDYCIDLLESAAKYHLLVNFHGATVPRGWQRTYPHLLSTEGVYGAEWYNNVPTFTKRAAAHNATLPFTRNVIGPMDYTPCAFSDSQHPHITSHAHELALTVLFESGLQHLADRPESFLAQPAEVQQFLGELPAVWDDTRLLGGYPADYVVIARRSGKTWYVAGINGTDEAREISFSLKPITSKKKLRMTVFEDGGDASQPWNIRQNVSTKQQVRVACQPRGGFVFVI